MGPWPLLGIAIVAEVAATTALRASNDWAGGARIAAFTVVVVGYGASFWLLTLVLKKMELGISYAVWAGVGTALAAIVGIVLFGEGISLAKFACIGLIILGVVGLELSGAHS
ncbi:MAG: multidrug efflux SMR transporter [Solirubrobacterales bacterium]|nr:multidrug efflux SMR transporter [Solirubrobacterales bacterium]